MAGSRALLKVRGRQSLSRTASVAVVEVGNRVLVVGVSEGGVRLLTELDPEEIAELARRRRPSGPTGGRRPAARDHRHARARRLAAVHRHLEEAWAAATSQRLRGPQRSRSLRP